jgi:TolA-binding protein
MIHPWRIAVCGHFVLLALTLSSARPLQAADSDAATRQYAAAVALQNRGAYDLATDTWVKFIKENASDSRLDRAYHYLGVCYYQVAMGDLDGKQTDAGQTALGFARQCFEKVAKDFQKFDLLESTYLYLGLTQFKQAQLAEVSPNNKESNEKAKALYQSAAATLDKLLQDFPQGKNLAQAYYLRGDCAYHGSDKAAAAKFYNQALAKSPDEKLAAEITYALGSTQAELGQNAEAGQSYDDFLKKFPQHRLANEVILRRAETLYALGQFQPAAQWYASAAGRAGFDLADYALRRQAEAIAQTGKYEVAADLVADMVTRFPNSKESAVAMAKGHQWAGKLLREQHPADALALVDRILAKAAGRNDIAALLLDRADAIAKTPSRRTESIPLYEAIAEKYPSDPVAPVAQYSAAYESLAKGDYAAALRYAEAFERSFSGNELLPDARYVEAESQLQLGKYADAEKIYGELLEKYPKHADADFWRVRQGTSLHLQKKYKETVALLEPVVGQLTHADAQAEGHYLVGSGIIGSGPAGNSTFGNSPATNNTATQAQFTEAIRHFQASLAAQPKWRQADETLFELAHAYYRISKVRQANESLRRILIEFPESKILDRVHYRLGEYANGAGDLKVAAAEYRQVVEKWPDSPLLPHALNGLGWALFDLADFTGADRAFDDLVTKFPQDKLIARGHYGRGMARYREGKFGEAIDDLQVMLGANDLSQGERSDARYVLGLCQVGMKKQADAIGTFRDLLKEDPKYAAADKVRFELAWALKSSGQNKEAVEAFAELIKQCPESSLVGECQFHVGEAEYKAGKFQAAALAFAAAMDKAGKTQLGEKASHNLGWAYYRLENFTNAEQTFAYERALWPQGPLAVDAAFMEAECLFGQARMEKKYSKPVDAAVLEEDRLLRQKKYAQALAAYEAVKNPSSKDFQVLTLLHSAQALGQLKASDDVHVAQQWQKSVELLDRLVKDFPDTPYLPEALYERGWALQNLGKLDEAVGEYTQVVAKSKQEAAARAQFMIGEVQFQQKKHAEALASFYQVLYGYAYPQWQADAAYEAARCFEVLKKKPQALKQYQELVEKFPQSDKVSSAKERIKSLESE